MEKNITEDLKVFKDLVTDVWTHGFMGVDIGKLITALLIFSAFLLIRGIFSRFALKHLRHVASKTKNKLDDKIIDALIPPLKFIPIILGIFFANQYVSISEDVDEFVLKVERSLIVFTIFWAFHRACTPLSHGIKKLEDILTSEMMSWLFKALKVLIIFLGAAIILEIWGIAVAPLLAGLGLFGAAVALGAQDLFKNLIGGMTIIAEKRFHAGEWIAVDGIVEGTVEDIGFRSTKVRRFDKAPVHVPNSNLSDAAVTNFSRMTHRRIKWKIGVVYKTDVQQLQIIRDGIMDYLLNNDAFAKPDQVSTFVRVDSFNASSIDFLVYCFTNTTNWGEWLEIKEAFAMKIKHIVEEEAKTSFAFPSQSIYIESMPDEAPEVFVPPKG
ncbi:MAG: mechanosensitive ion channel protein MscS [Micavibrio sp.]|nr:mechanosensitive ion channel protein MscS [Micavibrio sp.]